MRTTFHEIVLRWERGDAKADLLPDAYRLAEEMADVLGGRKITDMRYIGSGREKIDGVWERVESYSFTMHIDEGADSAALETEAGFRGVA